MKLESMPTTTKASESVYLWCSTSTNPNRDPTPTRVLVLVVHLSIKTIGLLVRLEVADSGDTFGFAESIRERLGKLRRFKKMPRLSRLLALRHCPVMVL